jgi:hypothetical protein
VLTRLNRKVAKFTQSSDSNSQNPKNYKHQHFVVTLYKYPGNTLCTIFIPILILAALSLAVFFQGNNLSDRISLIATMVLGFIQLIPSVKNELPSSSSMTILEVVIYIETLCCMLPLIECLLIGDI